MCIVLITPTGGRQDQIDLCALYMNRQTYKGEVVWIIVDDCLPRTTIFTDNKNWTVIKVYPQPFWEPGQNSQGRNIAAGIDALKDFKDIEGIFIIEDDDYYKPEYLERMMLRLKGFDIAGEKNTIYYNALFRRYVTNPNTAHSSLFQTAFSVNAIPILKSCYTHRFIDCEFWKKVSNKNLFNENNLAIGIKGLPGRVGIGMGHKGQLNMKEDTNLSYLKSLIGQDYEYYERYYRDNGLQFRPLFAKRS